MRFLFKVMIVPLSLFIAFLALMAKWLFVLSSYIIVPLMLYIFGCGVYTVYHKNWNQFLILLVAEFGLFILICVTVVVEELLKQVTKWLSGL